MIRFKTIKYTPRRTNLGFLGVFGASCTSSSGSPSSKVSACSLNEHKECSFSQIEEDVVATEEQVNGFQLVSSPKVGVPKYESANISLKSKNVFCIGRKVQPQNQLDVIGEKSREVKKGGKDSVVTGKDSVSQSKFSGFQEPDCRYSSIDALNYDENDESSKTKHFKSRGTIGRWTQLEHEKFLQGIRLFGKDWRKI